MTGRAAGRETGRETWRIGRRVQDAGRAWWRPLLWASGTWFAHFLLCWVAAEVWPRRWPANAAAWVLTPVALAALGLQALQAVRAAGAPAGDDLRRWNRLVVQGALVIAAIAVVFTALPSLVFRP